MKDKIERHFFRLKYHQGYYDACRDLARLLRSIRATEHQKFIVQLLREWAEQEFVMWEKETAKGYWRSRDQPPRPPFLEILERARAVKDPEGRNSLPFLGDYDHEQGGFLSMTLGAMEED